MSDRHFLIKPSKNFFIRRLQPHGRLMPAQFRKGAIVLLAQLLDLLVNFIGPGLTSRLMGEIWPQLAAENVDFGIGDGE